MKKTSYKNTYLSKYLYIYHSSHHSYIKKTYRADVTVMISHYLGPWL